MKNIIRFNPILLTVISLVVLSSCTKDLVKSDYDYNPNQSVTLSTLRFDSLEKVTDEAIKLQATLLDTAESVIYDQGFIYSTSEDFETFTAVSVEWDTLGTGEVQILLDEYTIPQGKDFYFKAFVLHKDGISLSEEMKTIFLPVTWETIGSVNLTDNTFSGDTYSVDFQKFKGRNQYRLVDPFQTGEENFLTFFIDDNGNALESEFPAGSQPGAEGYFFYWHPGYVGSYCTFSNKANVYTITFLLLSGGSLYTGGEIIFEWVDGYPGEIPVVIDYNMMAVEPVVGAVSEYFSEAFYGENWTQVLSKAVDVQPENADSPYKDLYYFADLYAEKYGLAFYFDGDTVVIPANQKTGAQYRSQDLYVSPSEMLESSVKTFANGMTFYSFGLNFHFEDGSSLGEFTETFYYSVEALTYEPTDFYGNYTLTGITQFEGYPDASMSITIAAGASIDTFIITGIDYAASVVATFNSETSVMSIAPQTLADFVTATKTYDMTLYTTTVEGDVSTTEAIEFEFNMSGDLVLTENTIGDGYLIRSDSLGGWVDGYYALSFTPQAPASAPSKLKAESNILTNTPVMINQPIKRAAGQEKCINGNFFVREKVFAKKFNFLNSTTTF